MDFYNKKFQSLQDDFYQVMHDYPLFQEMIDDLYDNNIKEINELLEKNDEYYLKSAIDKLERVIDYVKNTSEAIDNEYKLFDKLVGIWEEIHLFNVDKSFLDKLNEKIRKANLLIQSHDLKEIKEANKIMEEVIKDTKS